MKKSIKIWGLIITTSAVFLQNATGQGNRSNYGGLGVIWQLDPNQKYPVILEIQKGMPADQANLESNDLITKINNVSTHNMSVRNINSRLEGYVGSGCYITISRNQIERLIYFTREKFSPKQEPRITEKTDSPEPFVKANPHVDVNYSTVNFISRKESPISAKRQHIHSKHKVSYIAHTSNTLKAQRNLAVVQQDQSTEPNYGLDAIIQAAIAVFLDYFYPDNPVSDNLWGQATSNAIKALTQ